MLTYHIIHSKLGKVKPMDWDTVVTEEIEETIKAFRLTITQRTTLITYPGSIHWHLKKGKEKGILEITCWPEEARLWIDIADNRRNKWNLELIEPFAQHLATLFKGKSVLGN